MFKTIVVVLGLSPLLACMPMDDQMTADAMMDGDAMMGDGDTMS
jgi:hypothetical protein